jgi:hypothetical protein
VHPKQLSEVKFQVRNTSMKYTHYIHFPNAMLGKVNSSENSTHIYCRQKIHLFVSLPYLEPNSRDDENTQRTGLMFIYYFFTVSVTTLLQDQIRTAAGGGGPIIE